MLEWLMELFGVDHLPNLLLAIVAVIGALVGLYHYGKKAVTAGRATVVKWDNVHDALVGAGPIRDPETGKVLREEKLPLVTRVANLEEAMHRIADVLTSMTAVERDLAKIIEWQRTHEAWSDEIVKKLKEENEAEHAELWEAIKNTS